MSREFASLSVHFACLLITATPGSAQEKATQAGSLPAEKQIDLIFSRINEHRKVAGLRVVSLNRALSEGAQLHAEYLRQNSDLLGGPAAHTEEVNRAGYSEAGKVSANRSQIGQFAPLDDPAWVVDNLMATLYHRVPFLAPHLLTVGIGSARFKGNGYLVVVDTSNAVYGNGEVRDPVLFPAPDQTGVPPIFAHGLKEWPNPIPSSDRAAGYPITVSVAPNTWQPGEVEMSLADEKGTIDCWFSSPAKPARKDREQRGVFCLIPRDPLKPKTTYKVTFKCKKYGVEKTPEWTKTWSFSTADK